MKFSLFLVGIIFLPVLGLASDYCSKDAIAKRDGSAVSDVWDEDVTICLNEQKLFNKPAKPKAAVASNTSSPQFTGSMSREEKIKMLLNRRAQIVTKNVELSSDTPSGLKALFANVLKKTKRPFSSISLSAPAISYVDYVKKCSTDSRAQNNVLCDEVELDIENKLNELDPAYASIKLSDEDLNLCQKELMNETDFSNRIEYFKAFNAASDVSMATRYRASSFCKLHKISKEKNSNIASSTSYSCQNGEGDNICGIMQCKSGGQKELCEICLKSNSGKNKCFERFEKELASGESNNLKQIAERYLDALSSSDYAFRELDELPDNFFATNNSTYSSVRTNACKQAPYKSYCSANSTGAFSVPTAGSR
ncbi:MAG: hypothetical protein VX642_02130 [Bdellovibrionota bacterium]|nr:hypothetical protein [Bdellovibrionota bacterium]